jgi:hypothetical protein
VQTGHHVVFVTTGVAFGSSFVIRWSEAVQNRRSTPGTLGAIASDVDGRFRLVHALPLLVAVGLGPSLRATGADADRSMRQFLARDAAQPAYRAVRRLEAINGKRSGWLEAATEYSPDAGFRYAVTAEGGNGYIRDNVLRAVLDAEREVIARGEGRRSSLAEDNYTFHANGIDEDGLVNVSVSPRRKEQVLVAGQIFLKPEDGRLVRLQGKLAKSPSFWIRNVAIVRTYDRIAGSVVPVAMESQAQMRVLGNATLNMTYQYSHINGRPISPSPP